MQLLLFSKEGSLWNASRIHPQTRQSIILSIYRQKSSPVTKQNKNPKREEREPELLNPLLIDNLIYYLLSLTTMYQRDMYLGLEPSGGAKKIQSKNPVVGTC